MRPRWSLVAAGALGLFMAGFVAVLATRPGAKDQQAKSPLLLKPAPDISGTNLLDGSTFALSSVQGKFTLVNFFASWCGPCQEEQPQLVRWAHEPGHAVVGVVFNDNAGQAKRYMIGNGGDWPVLDDPQGQLALTYGVRDPPESYLLAPDGTVLDKFVGGVTASGLDQIVAAVSRSQ